MNNIRIDWIDLTKGIAIFLMVCGHTSIPLSMGHRTKRFFQWSGKMGERF